MTSFFDRDGHPIELMTWARMFSDEAKILARTPVGPMLVITAWIGTPDIDEDPPLIFGSVINVGTVYSDEIRTATHEGALLAHVELVKRCEDRLAAQADQ